MQSTPSVTSRSLPEQRVSLTPSDASAPLGSSPAHHDYQLTASASAASVPSGSDYSNAALSDVSLATSGIVVCAAAASSSSASAALSAQDHAAIDAVMELVDARDQKTRDKGASRFAAFCESLNFLGKREGLFAKFEAITLKWKNDRDPADMFPMNKVIKMYGLLAVHADPQTSAMAMEKLDAINGVIDLHYVHFPFGTRLAVQDVSVSRNVIEQYATIVKTGASLEVRAAAAGYLEKRLQTIQDFTNQLPETVGCFIGFSNFSGPNEAEIHAYGARGAKAVLQNPENQKRLDQCTFALVKQAAAV